ncbi:kinase-like protein [Macrolepiota fuliginosa MF-IS2]|uniref:non-specific serine/threonine protein kinase n=1 Tax=Macrolepiota fuliginosa MF-IS2 TaxID=1400762 RepID=A0A9P5XEP8_9AGAR|nr:kinase-like protein [Macrolepiota fuliginosa MF-IS2]
MAALGLLSHHSSNPLEVGSSDPRNNTYGRRYRTSLARNEDPSSDDPIEGFTVPEDVRGYHDHLSRTFPNHPAASVMRRPTPTKPVIDTDEDMSDDELATPMKQQHEQMRQRVPAVVDEESHEEGHSDKDEANEYGDDDDERMSVDSFETDEENTINDRCPEERKEIEEEIQDLMESVPQLQEDYKIVDRLGTGTFSSVYKAVDLHYHTKWDNTTWHGHHPPESSAYYQSVPRPPGSKVFVAVKRIYVTSSPDRIKNEVSIMIDCLNCRHVSQLITAMRNFDQIVLIMPYQRNEDFREFYRTLSMPAVKSYMRCLIAGLRDIHERRIIHRDVKPANFLFDPRTAIGTLCDFGLASRMTSNTSQQGQCLHTGWSRQQPHGQNKHLSDNDKESIRKLQKEARNKCSGPAEKVGYPDKDSRPISKANRAGTRGFRAPEVLLKCSEQTGAIDVWAAGMILLFFLSGKFPLFQSNDDIEALMEIAAIIGRKSMERTATLHSRLFISNVPSALTDGITWREFITKQNPDVYKLKDPDLHYYPFNTPDYRAYLQEEAERAQQPPLSSSPTSPTDPDTTFTITKPDPGPIPTSATPSLTRPHPLFSPEQHVSDVDSAFDLLEQLLHPESTKRITPKRALAHPFLAGTPDSDDALPDDDEFVPHEFGKGVCGKLHFRDDVTDDPRVKVKARCECGRCGGVERDEVRALMPGEGVAIGRQPCEFHEDMELEF